MVNQSDMEYGWFAKARYEASKASEKEARLAKWGEAWEALRRDRRNGTVKKLWTPILITSSGPFTSPEKVQEVLKLPSTPKMGSAPTASLFEEESIAAEREDRVQYCEVETDHRYTIMRQSYGEMVMIWFHGGRRNAWLAYGLKTETECQWEAFRKASRTGELKEKLYPIIINTTGPLTSPQKIQELIGLSSPPEVKDTTMGRISELEHESQKEEYKVQYCMIDFEHLSLIEAQTEGEDVVIWIDGRRRCTWLAHSMKKKDEGQDIKSESSCT
ncbi:uncharacterized protein GIQ15_06634 [Arthroderma uncinatum]|uniref:uncharacterized protein n=1 Tax=Arthroderma uncinatum TaxID=74035 RepID=UPI00144AD646|nr:uncharacterized protein GIQ15_06634 [Arthroderma uncinatum]KAF3479658.1 hypothetical protein GIQ15_06634 [Arthroderma uncinatum]